MNVLLTGASGFLGKYIIEELKERKYNIDTLGRNITNTITCDLSKSIPQLKEYDLVIHAAGKAHIIPSNTEEEEEFYNINLKGSKNLLSAFNIKPKAFVFISTVAVYGLEYGLNIKENTELKAQDPYGQSKILAEQYITQWGMYNNCMITILRLPLIFGLNAPGNLGKMIVAIKKGFFFNIDKGEAKKSAVLASDIAAFIPIIAPIGGVYNLTDGQAPSFGELSKVISKNYNTKKIISIPYFLAKILAITGDTAQKLLKRNIPFTSRQLIKMKKSLTFSDDNARLKGWLPNKIIDSPKQWLD